MNDTTFEERNENYSPYTPLPPQEQKTPNHFILFQASLSVCSQWNFFLKFRIYYLFHPGDQNSNFNLKYEVFKIQNNL